MKNPNRLVPEVKIKSPPKPRAGFIPGWEEAEVELWQVWMHRSDGEESRRATVADLESAGFKRKKGKR